MATRGRMATSQRRRRHPFFYSRIPLDQGQDIKLEGVVVFIKEDKTFGFIKPLQALPGGYTKKNVHFNLSGVKFEQGDKVKFVLRNTDKERPNAQDVWLVKRAQSSVSSLLSQQSDMVLGTIVDVNGSEGIIQIGEIPPEYKDKSDRVYFSCEWVSSGHLSLMVGDRVEFRVGENKKHSDELSAYRIKLIECCDRTASDVRRYIQKVKPVLKNSEELVSILSCSEVWNIIGKCKDFSSQDIFEILDFIKELDQKSRQLQENFKSALKTLLASGFCNMQNGTLKKMIQGEWATMRKEDKQKLSQFLLTLLRCVPERSRLIVKLMEFMLPAPAGTGVADAVEENEDKVLNFYFHDALKLLIQDKPGELQDYDWNELPLVPNADEFSGSNRESQLQLHPVKVKGPYESVEDYMDTYFRLLREDCFSSLKSGIEKYLQNTLDPRDMFVYKDVALVGVNISENGAGIALALRVTPQQEVQNWETCPNLMSGNLLCLSPSGSFQDIIWVTVADRDAKLLKMKGTVWVEFPEDMGGIEMTNSLAEITKASGQITIAESPTYYRAYYPVLKSLQQLMPCEVPFQEELIHMQDPKPSPHALNKEEMALREPDPVALAKQLGGQSRLEQLIRRSSLNNQRLGAYFRKAEKPQLREDTKITQTMDESQKAAFKDALDKRIAVIQGPPGTGKTHIGIQIVRKLLEEPKTDFPIAVLTYKNHALDEFLKEIIYFSEHSRELGQVKETLGRVVRIGGRSKEPEVQKCNLTDLKRHEEFKLHTSRWGQLKDRAHFLKDGIVMAMEDFAQSDRFGVQAVLNWLTEEQINGLLQSFNCQVYDKKGKMVSLNSKDMFPLWHKSKNLLLSKSPFHMKCMKTPWKLIAFLESAIMQWAPSVEEFRSLMVSDDTYVSHLHSKQAIMKNRKKKMEPSEENRDLDEKDVKALEDERQGNAGKRRKEYTMDVNVKRLRANKEKGISMTSSAKKLAVETSLTTIQHIPKLLALNLYDRAIAIQVILYHNHVDAKRRLEKLLESYNQVQAELQEIDNERKLAVLKKSKVVGMTITGASINQSLLRSLQPSIVIIEEAAEVLEAQVLAILGSCNVKHLILIGDHKQLRPAVESYNLRQNYHFDVSMMERLINNGYPHTTLQMQNRMLPEMANLLKDIYPKLESNLSRVMLNKRPTFTPSPIFFWSHRDEEETGRSYNNKEEAKRVIQLALFCVAMGYKPSQITILAAYMGQVNLLRSLLRSAEQDHAHLFSQYNEADEKQQAAAAEDKQIKPNNVITIHTVDMFQGDENDIVIISLVRSNDIGQIGFMRTLNRRCVAQSRAKCGMFFVGNEIPFLQARGSCWISLIQALQEQNLVQPQFTVQCPQHPKLTEIRATVGTDLPLKIICKERCKIEMPCKTHPCPGFCCPKHSHEKCQVKIDFVLPCQHPAKRKCYQSELDIVCRKPCTKLMDCQKHPCPWECGKSHLHSKEFCKVIVDFAFQDCQHPSKKECGENEINLQCKAVVNFSYQKCGHNGQRPCWKAEASMPCKEKCPRLLPCKHPCEGLCGDACDSSKCNTCNEIRKVEKEHLRKAEKKARQNARLAAGDELKQFIIKNEDLTFTRSELSRHGDDASEYLDIEDRVRKYIQPGHGWFPEVVKIEKITNLELQKQWIEAKTKMVNPMRSELKFHGTSKEAVDKIVEHGFRINRGGKHLMYGNGIYFATDSSKSAQEKYTKGSNMLLLCDVLIGHSKTVKKAEKDDINQDTLRTAGYDSLFAPRKSQVQYDEYVIFDPAQALPKYVIHYTAHGVNTVLKLPISNPTVAEKHVLLPKGEIDLTDPLEMHFRLAESQFLRLTKRIGSDDKVKQVEYYPNPHLTAKFEAKKKQFHLKYGTNDKYKKTVLAFHGTPEKNIKNIMRENFSMDCCERGAYGKGIYLSELPDISKGYDGGSRKLILCQLLPGKGKQITSGQPGASLEDGFDSYTVKEDKDGRAWAHVIYDPDQILPLYVISY